MRSVVRMMPIAVVTALAVVSVACGEVFEDSDSGDAAHTVNPTGGPAKLLISVPPGLAVTPEASVYQYPYTRQAAPMAVGTAVEKNPGNYCVSASINLAGKKFNLIQDQCFTYVKSGQTTTIPLGGISFARKTTDVVLGIDKPFLPVDGTAEPEQAKAWRAFVTSQGLMPFPNGAFDLGGWFHENLKDNEVVTRYIDSGEGRSAVRILPPDPSTRTLPDLAVKHGIRFSGGGYRVTEPMTRIEKTFFFGESAGKAKDQKAVLRVYKGELDARVTDSVAVYLKSKNPMETTEIAFARLEVADVEVTMPDGTKRTVPGEFSAKETSESAGDGRIIDRAPTGGGIDVPKGTYRISLSFNSPLTNTFSFQTIDVTL